VNNGPSKIDALRARLAEIHYLGRAEALLGWDERTMMPPGGAEARTDQIAALVRVRHEKLADEELGRLLDELEPFGEELSYDSDDSALIRVAKRDHEKARRVPIELRAEIARAASVAEHVWREAKQRNDFELFLPHLERNVYLKLRYAHCFEREDAYDPLLDDYEPGMKTPEMAAILDDLKEALIPLVAELAERAAGVDDSFLRQEYPAPRQREVVCRLLGELPMPGESWRLDETTHPFQMSLSPTDVRLTTRYDEHDLELALFSTLHEYGHGLYENGVDPALDGTPLGRPSSLGLHESQSRMWENLVGRSLPFWRRFNGMFGESFPDKLNGVDAEGFFRAVNKVERSLIRIEADELTYDLHILVRFELERELIGGTLEPRDLPGAWNERVQTYLGIEVPDDARGVMQDVHWAAGEFGYFPTYSLGNVIAAQLWEAAHTAIPDLDDQIEQGRFMQLREWLREHVHRHGRKYSAAEVVERATGKPIEVGPYVTYLTDKFRRLYAPA
jgi:carboxypeptidase Taq